MGAHLLSRYILLSPSRLYIFFSECISNNVVISTVNNGENKTESFRLVAQFPSYGTFGILCEKGN